MKPREAFIKNKTLCYFRSLPLEAIKLPLDIVTSVCSISNCAIMTYQEFAQRHGITIEQVIRYNESENGATHYDTENDRYLILYNDDSTHNIMERQRFTVAHEVGHILLGHLPYIMEQKIAMDNIVSQSYPLFEQEADWCASVLLCPFPVLKEVSIKSPEEIRKLCGLSAQASLIKYEQYSRWLLNRRRTAWDNDVKQIFSPFINDYKNHATTAIRIPKLTISAPSI